MNKSMKRVIGLTLLLAMLAFPAPAMAFGSSNDDAPSAGLFANLFSWFGSSSHNDGGKTAGWNGIGGGHDNGKSGFADWWKKLWYGNWGKDWCWWDDHKDDSSAIWKKYYGY